MANRRMISGDLFEDDFITTLSYFERLVWIGLITTVADDQGRMMDNPALIRARVFLLDSVQDSEVETALKKLASARKIDRYVSGNKRLIQIVNWWKYQTPAWASASKYPAPDKWTDRAKYHTVGNKIVVTNWDKVGGYVVGYVPGLHSGIEEGDVKGEDDDKGEGEGEAPPPNFPDDEWVKDEPFEQIRLAFVNSGIQASTADDSKAITSMVNDGVTAADVLAGIAWKAAHNDGKPVSYVSQVTNPARVAMRLRLQKNNGHGVKMRILTDANGNQLQVPE